jgi:adenylate cyclase class IV
MTAPYEAEVRVRVPHIEDLRERLAALGARSATAYAFTDHYYHPESHWWPPQQRTLRIREFPSGEAEVLFTRIAVMTEGGVTFKRSAMAQGKAVLSRGSLNECRDLLDHLGFVPWLRVRKLAGEIIEVPDLGQIACEQIEGHGWWLELEVEGADPAAAAAALRVRFQALGIDPLDASPLPVAALVGSEPVGRRLYFCGAIRGGRQLQARYARFIAELERAGWEVLTPHVGLPEVPVPETGDPPTSAGIHRRDMAWLAAADVVVADVTVPSLGVGIELATAAARGTPVFALVEEGVSLSALVEGDDRITLIRYRAETDAIPSLLHHLTALTSHAGGFRATDAAR